MRQGTACGSGGLGLGLGTEVRRPTRAECEAVIAQHWRLQARDASYIIRGPPGPTRGATPFGVAKGRGEDLVRGVVSGSRQGVVSQAGRGLQP